MGWLGCLIHQPAITWDSHGHAARPAAGSYAGAVDISGADPPRIVLIGMMGAGKSTTGRRLAARLGWRYVDNDAAVRELTMRDAPEVILSDGEAALHAAEAAAFLRALADPEPLVIAAAAGVVEDAACASALRRQACVVYLRARPATLRGRIGSGAGRRTDATALGWLEARFVERDGVYRQLAGTVIDVDDLSRERVVDLIIGWAGPAGGGTAAPTASSEGP